MKSFEKFIFIMILAALVGLSVSPTDAVFASSAPAPMMSMHIVPIAIVDTKADIRTQLKLEFSEADSGEFIQSFTISDVTDTERDIQCYIPYSGEDLSVAVDKKIVSTNLRYAYYRDMNNYLYSAYTLRDEFISDPNKPVIKYTYRLNADAFTANACISLEIAPDTCIVTEKYYKTDIGQKITVYDDLYDEMFVFYAIGGEPSTLEISFSEKENLIGANGSYEFVGKENMTLLEFTDSIRKNEISQVDWFNIVASQINDGSRYKGGIINFSELESSLAEFSEFTIHVGAGHSAECEISMPVEPLYIETNYINGYTYVYYVDLSFAKDTYIDNTQIMLTTPFSVRAPEFSYDKEQECYIWNGNENKDSVRYLYIYLKDESLSDGNRSTLDIFQSGILNILARLIIVPLSFVAVFGIYKAINKHRRER